MKIFARIVFGTALFFYASVGFALDGILFGPEFTFANLDAGTNSNFLNVVTRMNTHLVLNQPEGAAFTRDGALENSRGGFTSPNGWTFKHHKDGEMGFEVQITPGTIEYFRQFGSDMQDAIFVSAANEGYFPAMFAGGGHINISIEPFFKDPLLFRNFIVDLLNHSELFMGVFGYDTNNALSLGLANEDVIKAVKNVIARFDAGEFGDVSGLLGFAKAMEEAQNTSVDPNWRMWHPAGWETRSKYHAVNFQRVSGNSESRLELRGVRPQASMDMWSRQIELLHARIQYLEKIRVPIPLRFNIPFDRETRTNYLLNPPLDPQLALRAFHGYVRQSGKRWVDHRDYLWPKWVADGELEKFESSKWFLRREKKLVREIGGVAAVCEGELLAAE